ncbi:MAG: flagellar hook-associated protein FlgK [Alphaproteobacteria bacterium]|nr:MAG: flagellar hook-associated protein FlgK [Alphaproteobacteria bacterium]
MSLSGALNAAQSGLAASQTMSQVAAENISNAMTPGYVRRNAALVSIGIGQGGVVVGEIQREVDAALDRLARIEQGKTARHQAVLDALQNYTSYLGQPGDARSLPEKYSVFSSSLSTLANQPASLGAQKGAVLAAEELAATIRTLDGHLAGVRADVDLEIRYDVADLNESLYDLAKLNETVRTFRPGTPEHAQYSDLVDTKIDEISAIVDVRVSKLSDGSVALFTLTGAALLEGNRVHDVKYFPGDGSLMAGEQDITPGKSGVHGVEHGSLSGLLALVRDVFPRFQDQLDEYARGLIQSFEASDATLGPGQAGLFTDGGGPFDPSNAKGLAGRIEVNAAVRQDGGNEAWRIRDGLGAASEGPAADASQVISFLEALDAPLGAGSATGIAASTSVADFASALVAAQSAERANAEERLNEALTASEVITAARQNAEGTNIDEELSRLQLIEKSYAANAKILSAVSEMLDELLAAV